MIRTGAGGRYKGLRRLRFLLVPALALVAVMALFPNDTFIIGGGDYYRRLTDFIRRSLGDPE